MKERALKFLKSTFSEADGSASASRVLGGACVVSTLGWVTYLVLKNGALPELSGAALFVGSGFSGYGMNKLSGAMKGKTEEPKDSSQS